MSQDEGASDSYCVPCARMPARMMHGTANSNCERLPPTFDSFDLATAHAGTTCMAPFTHSCKPLASMIMRRWLPLVTLTSSYKSSSFAFVTRNARTYRENSHRRSITRMSIAAAPLIDVDCNLWHKDLTSLQSNQDGSSPLCILNEDAIEESNIVAMLSPSSTLDEWA